MSAVLGNLGKAWNAAVGAIQVAQAVHDIKDVVGDAKLSTIQKVHRLAADVLVIGANGLSAVAPYRNWSPDAKLALNGVLGAADTAQQVSFMSCKKVLELDDWLDFGCTVMFRASNFLEHVIELKPVQIGAHLPGFKYAAQFLFISYAGTRFSATVVFPFIRYMRERPHPIEMTLVLDGNRDPELRMDPRWLQDWNQILEAPGIGAFQRIPELLFMDPVLSQFKCSLSNNAPIRHIRAVKGTENTAHPIYYEKDAILRWSEQHPGKRPERWPDQIPFLREYIIESPPIQAQIENGEGSSTG